MAEYRIWPSTNGPGSSFNDGQPMSQGTEFLATSTAWATKIWYWRATANMGAGGNPVLGQIYRIDGGGVRTPLLGSPVSFASPGALGWQSVSITPISLVINQHYKVVVYYPNGEYTATPGNNYWNAGGPGASGITNGPLHAVAANNSDVGQATFLAGSGIQYPTSVFQSGNYWIDVSISDVNPAGTPKNGAFMSFFA